MTPISSIRYRQIIVALLVIMSLQLAFAGPAEAAFMLRSNKQTAQRQQTTVNKFEYHSLKNSFLKQFLFRKPFALHQLRGFNASRQDDPTFGIISLVAGIIGLACALLISASASPGVFVVIGVVAAILAIICGAIGLGRQMKGLAIIGMTLGILEIIAGVVIVAIIARSLS